MVREYVGARYMPKFMGNFDNTIPYEPLSIVDDGLGNSYTSKKPVPAGTLLTDTEYWALTGSMSGAIISLQNRVSFLENEYANVKLYGAVGDGVTDDTQAFKDAFNTGLNVYIPDGQYVISDYVEIPSSNVIVFGSGTILDQSPAPTGYDIGCLYAENKSNIIIDGIKIQGTGAGLASTVGSEISFNDCTNVKVVNCEISEVIKNYGICFRHCDTAAAIGNYLHRFTYCGIIGLNSCDHLSINDNILIDPTGISYANTYGVVLSGYDYPDSGSDPIPTDLKAIGNYVKASSPHWEGIDAHSGVNVVIAENVVENTYTGIAMVGSSATRYIKRLTIANNVLNGPTSGTGYASENCGIVTKKVEDCAIIGNVVKNWGKIGTGSNNHGIRIIDTTGAIVSDNEISGTGSGAATDNAINVTNGDKVAINNNTIVDNNIQRCIAFAGNSENVSIKNNFIRNSGTYYVTAGGMNSIKPTTLKVLDNDSDNYLINSFANVIPERITTALIASVRGGEVGDVIRNTTPSSGNPIGWVCTVAETSSTPATWVALQNI